MIYYLILQWKYEELLDELNLYMNIYIQIKIFEAQIEQ